MIRHRRAITIHQLPVTNYQSPAYVICNVLRCAYQQLFFVHGSLVDDAVLAEHREVVTNMFSKRAPSRPGTSDDRTHPSSLRFCHCVARPSRPGVTLAAGSAGRMPALRKGNGSTGSPCRAPSRQMPSPHRKSAIVNRISPPMSSPALICCLAPASSPAPPRRISAGKSTFVEFTGS